jgi:hypothetical protein
MGKLAQRLADPSRSGVYRVRGTAALEEAAAQNGQRVLVLVLDNEDALLQALKAEAEKAKKRGRCFFAALLDAEGEAALPPLYNEKA